MRKLIKSLIFLTALLCALESAIAGDSATIAVSCTIPAIPGVNAPPFPDKIKLTDKDGQTIEIEEKRQVYTSEENTGQEKQKISLVIARQEEERQTIYAR